MNARSDKTKLAILKALQELDTTAGASRILERLAAMGYNLRPRTVRFYLLQLDREGMTRFISRRRGRELTPQGRDELAHANVVEKIGFIAARVDALGYRMSFRLARGEGTIITNVALLDRRILALAIKELRTVFAAGYGMGTRVAFALEGERLADMVVPAQTVAVATVCSVTLNGVMLHAGIPVTSRYGGLVEVRNGEPVRFVELIDYAGTTLDPLEAFIMAGMTRVRECAQGGSGIIGASFREVPSVALEDVQRIRKDLEQAGLAGILAVGRPNRPLLDVPVAEGRTGIVVIGGLNPVAAVHEAGVRLTLTSLSGLEDYRRFLPFEEAVRQLAEREKQAAAGRPDAG